MRRVHGFVMAIFALGVVAGCASADPRMALLKSCDAYASTLSAVSAGAARGRLNEEQIQSVQEIRQIVNPICGSPPSAMDSSELALSTVQSGLEQLVFYNSAFGETR